MIIDDKPIGLSSSEVEERISQGKVNVTVNLKTKSVKRIFYDNICTLFNAINIILFLALVLVGSYKNLLFIGVVVSNTAIGIFQEIRSKISVDKLTLLSEKKVSVVRNGVINEINKEEIVSDDIIILSRGDQIPTDCTVYRGECKVNESLLTGESDLIEKKQGSKMLSGSFLAAGKCYAIVTNVGADSYAAKISNEAKYIKKINSQILNSFNFIIKLCTFILFPIGVLFFIRQYSIQNGDVTGTVVSTVAALIGMIPKGMILLTSSVLAVSIIRLSSKKVLVQEMYCIETLARVDVLCLDKTGTLTTDEMSVSDIIPFCDDESQIKKSLASIVCASDEINATLNAIKEYSKGNEPLKAISFIPFSSETKWSGGYFENGKSYIIGAAEFVLPDRQKYSSVYSKMNKVKQTVRQLVLVSFNGKMPENGLPDNLEPLALILIKDNLRPNVHKTINYFSEQGVKLKVISGDSVKTVQNIALDSGIIGAENAVDMSTVTNQKEIEAAAEKYTVFGRVTPAQKKLLVLALKKHGHTVAMTGDGVNDVLALKEADCSVAMASGSEAARNVSQIVLVNNDFAAMPQVVAEGRRTINNLERSSSLYLVKTIYSVILSVFFIFFSMSYPFQPIQLTLVGAFTVGLPSFVLALQPNSNIVKGNFTFNIISRAMPAGLCVILNIIAVAIMGKLFCFGDGEFSTVCVALTSLSCLLLVIRLSIPFNLLRSIMTAVCIAGLILGSILFFDLLSLSALSPLAVRILLIQSVVTIVLFNVLYNIAQKLIEKNKSRGIKR